jgi:predicted acylesterase/phospholipase RssA
MDGRGFPTGTGAWLEKRRLSGHQHVWWQEDADFSRLARIVSRRSVGVVLGGGGAKGIAHIGVLRALEEAGIPIDMIGGSSMGAIIAGARALGWDHSRMVSLIKGVFQQSLFKEFTLPLISFLKSRKIDGLFRSICSDLRIEDLWTSYFCTSSNLYTCKRKVHREGPLWRAIRTSCSLPAIMVPMPYDGEVHIDGGVLNNLPCDVMRQDAGFVIAVDVDTYSAMRVDFREFPSPWKILWDRIRRKKIRKRPNIFEIILSAFRASNRIHVAEVKPKADLCIEPPVVDVGLFDFARMESILQIGCDCAIKALARLPEDSPFWKVRRQPSRSRG